MYINTGAELNSPGSHRKLAAAAVAAVDIKSVVQWWNRAPDSL